MKTMILIPALAPGAELIDYLQTLSDAQLGQLVVVDDGSGPDYAPILRWRRRSPAARCCAMSRTAARVMR